MIDLVTPETVGLSSDRLARVTEWLEAQVAMERLAGASVLIGRRGGVAYFETIGQADMAEGKPFTTDTIVRIYSMTKPVTAVAAMMLYEEGAFQLDDPVARYLPEFADTRVWVGGDADVDQTEPMASPMTMRHLMTHTSGLTYGFQSGRCTIPRGRHRVSRRGRRSRGTRRAPRADSVDLPAGQRLELQRRERCARSVGGGLVRDVARDVLRRAHLRSARHARRRLLRQTREPSPLRRALRGRSRAAT